jgi:hypothetical protein
MLLGLIATVLLALIFTGLDRLTRMLFGGTGHTKLSINNYYSSTASLLTVAENTGSGFRSTSKGLRFLKNQTPKYRMMASGDAVIRNVLRGSSWDTNRFYTTSIKDLNVKVLCMDPDRGPYTKRASLEPKLNPYWVTGFADGESTFTLKISRGGTALSGWNVTPEFKIELHTRDTVLLRKIHSFFGVGTVSERGTRNMAVYSVQSARAIANVIIPHFDKYPLITQKKADYLLFKQAVNLLLNCKARSSIGGMKNIISIRASMNKGLTDVLKMNFPDILSVPRPVISFEGIPNPNWLSGFVDGEGYFCVRYIQNKNYSTGFNVILVFSISQHVRDEVLLTKFIDYLGCGRIERASTRPDAVNFAVSKFSDIKEKIIPFFLSYPLHGVKYWDYCDFAKVAKIMEDKGHFTSEGLKKINYLKSGMNSQRENI